MKKAVIYARYSCSGQREQSIEDQVNDCKRFAKDNGFDVIEVYADYAKSGRSDNRANFQRMLADSDQQAFEVVIVWKLDRFGRNREEMAFNRYKLKKNNIKLVSAMEHISDDPVGSLMESILEGMAEFYSLNLSENVKRGMYSNAEKAKCNGPLPIGFKNEDGKIVEDLEYSWIIKKVFQMLYEGYTMVEVIEYLNENGIRRPDGKSFKRHTLDIIKKNERYIGTYFFGETVIPDALPKIVDPDIFYAVNKRKVGGPRRKPEVDEPYLLRGKLVCGKCGNNYVGETGTAKSGRIYRYYKCGGRKRGIEPGCENTVFKKSELEERILQTIFDGILKDEIIEPLAEKIIERYENQPNSVADKLLIQKNEVEKKLGNLVKAVENGSCSELIVNKIDEYEQQLEKIKTGILLEKTKNPAPDKKAVCWALKKFKIDFINNKHDKLNLVNNLIDSIVVQDDLITINLNYMFRNDNGNIVPTTRCSTSSLMVRQEGYKLNSIVINDDFTFSYSFLIEESKKATIGGSVEYFY